jgi:hypothetical protein
MPFVILGKEYIKLNIKNELKDKLFGTGSDIIFDEYNRRDYIYKQLQLVTNIHID